MKGLATIALSFYYKQYEGINDHEVSVAQQGSYEPSDK